MKASDGPAVTGSLGELAGPGRRTRRSSRLSWLALWIAAVSLLLLATTSASASADTTNCAGSKNVFEATSDPAYVLSEANVQGGSACLTLSSTALSWSVNSTSNTSSDALRFTGFYSTLTGCDGACTQANYEQPVSSYASAMTSWTFDNSHLTSTNSKYDAVYDMFFNQTTQQPVPAPTGAEVMIWLNDQNVDLQGNQLADVTIEGQTYHVFLANKSTSAGTWNRIAFERASPTNSVSNLDLVPFLSAAEADGALSPNWYWQDTNAGFEIWYGGGGLKTMSYSASTPALLPAPAASTGGSTGGTTGGSSGGTTGGATGGSTGGSTGGQTAKDTKKPNVSIGFPGCFDNLTKAGCQKWRHSVSGWTTVIANATDNVKVAKVTVTAARLAHGKQRAKKITVTAKRLPGTAFKAVMKGLTTGKWRFSAVAYDTAGNKTSTKPILTEIKYKKAID